MYSLEAEYFRIKLFDYYHNSYHNYLYSSSSFKVIGYIEEAKLKDRMKEYIDKKLTKSKVQSLVKDKKQKNKELNRKIRNYSNYVDVDKVEKKTKKVARKASKEINQIKSARDAVSFKGYFNYLKEIYTNAFTTKEAITAAPKSLLIFLIIFIINTFIGQLFFSIAGSYYMAMFLSYVVLAPLTEETSKRFAYQYGFGDYFAVYFPILEFFLYMQKATTVTLAYVIIRGILILSHQYWSYLHKLDNDYGGNFGYKSALLMHAINNAGIAFLPMIMFQAVMEIRNRKNEKEDSKPEPVGQPKPA